MVKGFAEENLLKLNVSKCDFVLFSSQKAIAIPVCQVGGFILPAGDVGKCLGYWWRGDLSASTSIDENIRNARCVFFHFGSIGVLQSDVNPLFSRAVLQSCVMPVLLFGCENWILTETLWQKLEAFQGELVKRVLKWPRHHSNMAATTVLEKPMMRYIILVRKLGFLYHVVVSNPASLTGHVLLALCDDVDPLCLVKECKEMEKWFGSNFTDIILSRSLGSIREMKKEILELDKKKNEGRCLKKAPRVAEVSRQIGWAWLWDAALDSGWKTVKSLQLLSRAMSHQWRGNHPCHLCDAASSPEVSVLDHILVSHREELHLDPVLDYEKLMCLLEELHLGVLSKFSKLLTSLCVGA